MTRAPTNRLLPIAVALLAACSSGSPEPGGTPEPTGSGDRILVERDFSGSVSLGGTTLPVTLRMSGPAGDLIATLTIPGLSVTANGGGTLSNGRLRLELAYGSDCRGEIELDGAATDDVRRVEGRVTADDCTGSEEGTVLLRAR